MANMRYTKLFGKTNKNSKEYDSVNATYLIKGGFIDQTMAGVYSYLPLGFRVLQKIEKIIREEMDQVGQAVFLPSIVPTEIWETTGRLEKVDVLFKVEGANKASKEKNDATYILNPTHEDTVTPIAQKFHLSYKDLPVAVYQIQTKFRNEARPKSGLLRGREFRMKDLYSFHVSEEDLKVYYEEVKKAYFKVYKRLGLGDDTYIAAASGGDFTEEYSHEFQTKCESGEEIIFYVRRTGDCYNREVAPSKAVNKPQDEKKEEMFEVKKAGVIGVEELCAFLNIEPFHTSKTMIYESDQGVLVASVRGDYEVNEYKLMKAAGAKWVKLASAEVVKQTTGAEIGYAGLVGLPANIKLFVDDALENMINFETGANKTDCHLANVNWDRDLKKPEKFYDIKNAKEGDIHPFTGEEYESFKASEVGNIFPLNTKFSKAFGYYFTDKDGSQKPVYMGSYGIGCSRVMGVIVEKFHDEKGIIWPHKVAPYTVHLIGLNFEDESMKAKIEDIYEKFKNAGLEVLYDDRENVAAGEKFADADLIGLPYRVVISKRTGDHVEIKARNSNKIELLTLEQALSRLILGQLSNE
jgi:prolyl-tRNA synthetase